MDWHCHPLWCLKTVFCAALGKDELPEVQGSDLTATPTRLYPDPCSGQPVSSRASHVGG